MDLFAIGLEAFYLLLARIQCTRSSTFTIQRLCRRACHTMEALQDELAAESFYAKSYTHMYELLQEVEATAKRLQKPVPEVTIERRIC